MTKAAQSFHLLAGIHGVAHKLPEKNLIVRVKKFFNYREDVLGVDRYTAFLLNHILFVFLNVSDIRAAKLKIYLHKKLLDTKRLNLVELKPMKKLYENVNQLMDAYQFGVGSYNEIERLIL